jgi:uncharacterized protein (TIGR02147 family)
MARPDIHTFSSFGEYLAAVVKMRKASNPSFSYTVLARQIGSHSPSLLTQIGSGRKLPTPALLHKLKDALRLTKKEHEYALALVAMERAKTVAEKAFYAERLRLLKPVNPDLIRELDRFDFFSSWYNVALVEMLNLKGFDGNPKRIADRLGHRIDEAQAQAAIDLLRRLQLIELQSDGSFRRLVADHVATPVNFPSETVRTFHKQMLELAAEAIDKQPVLERYISGAIVAVDTKRITEMQEMLREFRNKFSDEFQSKSGDQAYYIGLQLFRVTEGQS